MDNVKQFWEDQHQFKKTTWLTGTRLDQILEFYSLTDQDFENKKVLEIGVGLASVTQALSKLTSELYCADISTQALERASPYAKEVRISQEIDRIPAVDIALCHLVLVHCDDQECVRILRSINLVPDGKIYCQFSCLTSSDSLERASPHVKKYLVDSGMHFFRTENQITDIVARAGLNILFSSIHNPGSYMGWKEQFWKFLQLGKTS